MNSNMVPYNSQTLEKRQKIRKILLNIVSHLLAVILGSGTTILFGKYVIYNSPMTIQHNTTNTTNYVQGANTLTEQQICEVASELYQIGAYGQIISLYLTQDVNDSAIVQNNFGFLLANGLGCDKNIVEAESHYSMARQTGSEQALQNQLTMYINNYSGREEISQLINIGIKKSNDRIMELAYKELNWDGETPVTADNIFKLYGPKSMGVEKFKLPLKTILIIMIFPKVFTMKV